jgi:hypothetical protein
MEKVGKMFVKKRDGVEKRVRVFKHITGSAYGGRRRERETAKEQEMHLSDDYEGEKAIDRMWR